MTISYLKYPLENGYVHNWLVVGPQATLVADLDRYTGPDYKLLIAQHYYESESGIGQSPAERRPVTIGDLETRWEYVRCQRRSLRRSVAVPSHLPLSARVGLYRGRQPG